MAPALDPPRRPAMLKADDVADELQVSKRQAWRLIHNGEIESVKIGASRRVPSEAFESYLVRLRQAS